MAMKSRSCGCQQKNVLQPPLGAGLDLIFKNEPGVKKLNDRRNINIIYIYMSKKVNLVVKSVRG